MPRAPSGGIEVRRGTVNAPCHSGPNSPFHEPPNCIEELRARVANRGPELPSGVVVTEVHIYRQNLLLMTLRPAEARASPTAGPFTRVFV